MLDDQQFDVACQAIEESGYVVIPGILSAAEVETYRQALEPWIEDGPLGRNVFEGTRTHRIYAMLAKDRCFADLIAHPLALRFAEHFLGSSCLLSACLAIDLQPGESAQPWHTDDGHIDVPPPHGVFGISTFWTMDETTVDNGATEVLPGSHKWGVHDFPGVLQDRDFTDAALPEHGQDPGAHPDAVAVTLPPGSLMVARSDLWHRGGANRSGASRLIVTPQYCKGWARPLESMLLTLPACVVAELPPRVQELLGYSIHAPFMGYVDGMHPKRILGA
jgi:ectoine hydroxylase-related dioxygenase (phytanoyl-CoA dioxygenase family)